jgi:ribonuclease P protein subunit POP4
MISRENIYLHEWIGLFAKVKKSPSIAHAGLSGFIVDETKNTLVLENKSGEKKRIPKTGCVFELEISEGVWASVEGSKALYSPEERIKKLLRKG